MRKFIIGLITTTFIITPVMAGELEADKNRCLGKIADFDKKAQITEMRKIEPVEHYKKLEKQIAAAQKLIDAACTNILSPTCLETTNYWESAQKVFKNRITKLKSFALESDSTFYKINTSLYRYVCGVSNQGKTVVVVDND